MSSYPRITIESASRYDGQAVEIAGWLYNLRRSGKIIFPLVNATARESCSASP